jgi:hypothetical protein
LEPDDLDSQALLLARQGRHLIYHVEPARSAYEIIGFLEFEAWIGIDQPDTDIKVAVYDIAPDGGSTFLTSDWIRARYRLSDRSETLVETADPLPYAFRKFPFVARTIEPGHRIRLVIGAIDSIYWQKNYNSGGVVADEGLAQARNVTVRLFCDKDHVSRLRIPIGALSDG